MRALIMMAHGSRREASNIEFRDLVNQVREGISGVYDRVEHAFLDCVPPLLGDAVATLITAGAIKIDVYPYFLNTGKHADQDIPDLVTMLNAEHPNCRITVLDCLGKSDEIAAVCVRHLLLQSVSDGED